MRRIDPEGRYLAMLDRPERQAWTEWLACHRLDPNRILRGTDILCNDEERWVMTEYLVFDDEGHVKVSNGKPETTTVVRWFESPALPCPSGFKVTEEDCHITLTRGDQ